MEFYFTIIEVIVHSLYYIRGMRTLIILLTFFYISNSFAQDKLKIDVDAYYKWKSITDNSISSNGNIILSKQVSYRGNDTLFIFQKSDLTNPTILARADKAAIDYKERFVSYMINNDYDSIRKLKLEDVNKKKWPIDTAAVLFLSKDTIVKFSKSKNIKIGEEGGDWILMNRDDSFEIKKSEEKVKKCFFKKVEPIKNPIKQKGSILTILNAETLTSQNVEGVTSFDLSHFGNVYCYINSFTHNDTIDSAIMYVVDKNKTTQIFSLQGEIIDPTFNREGTVVAFKSSSDTGEIKIHNLYSYNLLNSSLTLIADTISDLFPVYQSIDASSNLSFARDGSKLFYKVGMKPMKEAKDTLTADEKYKLDLWSWTDGQLQPQQLLTAKKDAKGLREFVYHFDENKSVALVDTASVDVSLDRFKNSNYALIRDQEPYLKEMTWDFWYFNVYRVNLKNGVKELLYKKYHGWDTYLSKDGDYFCFFEPADSCWYSKNIETTKVVNLTKSIDDIFYNRNHDVAQKIGPDGYIKWVDDGKSIMIESQYDIWMITLDGISKKRFTKGKENNLRFRFEDLNKEATAISFTSGVFMKAFNYKTKEESIYRIAGDSSVQLLTMDSKILDIDKAKNSEDVIFQYMNFQKSPDLHLTKTDFNNPIQITNSNPQQENYNWGTVEMVHWKDYQGANVTGLLYKPEDFDSTKKYPMIVYFYERYSDNIHYYYKPKVTASIIYATEYISNGYLVFIPDISYKIGKPAQSAYNSIMSGTDQLLKSHSFIDSTKLGLQGQSWGGYQTAQLITMTTRFKCGMAGAPVSNMFSAYGGMRWGSGLSRTFQYETGQSRIGATIWESPELYIENSPLFHLPKVETPLLIMHNDGDGAVPWYQGVEMFNGLRRLNKPVWLLNYNGDEHNLMKDANRMDLSIRMRQFFDYYLLDEKLPEWMEKGLPAIDKGKHNAY